jgi:hypothetical protein
MTAPKPKTYRSPRRRALAELAAIKNRLQWLINRWDVSGTVYESVEKTYTEQHTGTERTYTDSVARKRQPHEYPENQAKQWEILYRQAEVAALEASELAEFALAQWRKCAGI